MLRRSLSSDNLRLSDHRPRLREDAICPPILPSKFYSDLVHDAFYPARRAKIRHSQSYADLNLTLNSYSRPSCNFALTYLTTPGWRDRLDHTLESAERVMDDVHKSLFPTKHHIHVGEWAYFDWDKATVVEPMCRPWWRTYETQRYSRCCDMRNWTNSYGRTFNHYAYERWRRFAGNRTVAGSWTWPPFWMDRFSERSIFTYKSPWYYTPAHHYYDYIYH